jgi:hypothetical protein
MSHHADEDPRSEPHDRVDLRPASNRSSRWAGLGTGLALVLLSLLVAPASTHAQPPDASRDEVRFALIIGYNHSDDPSLDALRYADDDAIRYHELLSTVTERAVLLTTPDIETQELLGDVSALAPTRQNLLDSLQNIRSAMIRAKAQGKRPVLYFVYSGHGNYDAEGRGYVHLADGRFTTRDLFHRVLEPTRDDPVILIIDACNAGLMVNGRGRPAEISAERRPTGASRLDLTSYPNVGLVLANSAIGETHEWGRFLAGVFSHEVRSGMLGAADLDDDQRINFAELAAFIASANARVKNPTVKVTPYIRPPLTDPNLALIDLSRATRLRGRLRIDSRVTGKAHIVDHDLVRYADFHRTRESASFWLAITRPGELVVATEHAEWIVPDTASGEVTLATLERRARSTMSARGAGSEYFDRTLFHEPFDRTFADRYLGTDYLDQLELMRIVDAPWWNNGAAWATLGGGLATVVGGFALHMRALDLEDEAFGVPWASRRVTLNDDAQTFATGSYILYGVGTAAVVTSILLFALDQPTQIESWSPPLAVDLAPEGVRLRATW